MTFSPGFLRIAILSLFFAVSSTRFASAEPVPATCFEVLSKLVDASQMSDALSIGDVSRSCYGNVDGGCVNEVCTQLGEGGCRERLTATGVAHSCASVRGGACVATTCSLLTGARCSDFQTVTGIARGCVGQ